MSTHDGQPRKRGGRVVARATPGQVTALARNLPLTHSVPGKAIENAAPGQLGFLANLFEKENASRAESKRRRLPGQAGFPRNKTLDGCDRGHVCFVKLGSAFCAVFFRSVGSGFSAGCAVSAAACLRCVVVVLLVYLVMRACSLL